MLSLIFISPTKGQSSMWYRSWQIHQSPRSLDTILHKKHNGILPDIFSKVGPTVKKCCCLVHCTVGYMIQGSSIGESIDDCQKPMFWCLETQHNIRSVPWLSQNPMVWDFGLVCKFIFQHKTRFLHQMMFSFYISREEKR